MTTYNQNLFYGASQLIHARAKELRKRMTPAEKILWEKLRGKSLGELKFRRQHPISKYIVDFYCHSEKLVIELDGSVHDLLDQKEYDSGREFELSELGLKIIRFTNEEVIDSSDEVLKRILESISIDLNS